MPELSTREKEVAAAAWRCIPANEFPKVDYEALAKATDMKTVKTASNAWSAFKLKLMTAEDPTKASLTDRDLLVARVAWLCVDAGNIPKINTALMVDMGLFKTAKTASNTWWKIKKTLHSEAGGNNAADDHSTLGKRKATASVQGISEVSPSPKKPRKARKPTKVKEETSETAEKTAAEKPPAENPHASVGFPAYENGAVFAPAI